MPLDQLDLPGLPGQEQMVDNWGQPTPYMQARWQELTRKVTDAVVSLNSANTTIGQNVTDIGKQQTTLSGLVSQIDNKTTGLSATYSGLQTQVGKLKDATDDLAVTTATANTAASNASGAVEDIANILAYLVESDAYQGYVLNYLTAVAGLVLQGFAILNVQSTPLNPAFDSTTFVDFPLVDAYLADFPEAPDLPTLMIRIATAADLPEIVRLWRDFLAYSHWRDTPLDEAALCDFAEGLMEAGIVFLSEEGMLGGLVQPLYFSPGTVVGTELFWWAPREGRALRQAFEAWCADQGASCVQFSGLADARAPLIDRLFRPRRLRVCGDGLSEKALSMAISTALAAIGSAGIKLAGSLASASAMKKQLKQNASLITDNRAANAQLTRDDLEYGTNLLTGARDTVGRVLDDAQQRGQAVTDTVHTDMGQRIRDTFTGNQGALDGTTRAKTDQLVANRQENQTRTDSVRDQVAKLLTTNRDANQKLYTENRDLNAGLITQAGAANESDIRDYSGRAEGAINASRTANDALFKPFIGNGQSASDAINSLLGLSGDASTQAAAFQRWADSTGYQYTLDSGRKAIESSQAAMGMLESGDTLKALQERGQQTGQLYFGNYLAALQDQAGRGLSAAGTLGSLNQGAAGQLAGLYQNTSQQLTQNRDNVTGGLTSNNSAYTSGMAGANNAYAQGMGANAHDWLATSNGINDLYTRDFNDNLTNYANGTIANSNALLNNNYLNDTGYRDATLSSLQHYADGRANSENYFASSLANLHSGATKNLILGNNEAIDGLTGNNLSQAQNSASLYGGLADAATDIWGALPVKAEPKPWETIRDIHARNDIQQPELFRLQEKLRTRPTITTTNYGFFQ